MLLSLANKSDSGFASLAARVLWLQITRQENRVYSKSRILCVSEGEMEPEAKMSAALSAACTNLRFDNKVSRSVSGAGWCEESRKGAAMCVAGTGAYREGRSRRERSSCMVRAAGLFDRVRTDAEFCWAGESRDEAGDAVRTGMEVGAGEGGNAVCSAGVGGWKVDTALERFRQLSVTSRRVSLCD